MLVDASVKVKGVRRNNLYGVEVTYLKVWMLPSGKKHLSIDLRRVVFCATDEVFLLGTINQSA